MNKYPLIICLIIFNGLIACTPPASLKNNYYGNGNRLRGTAGSKAIISTAKRYIGVRYVSGGDTPDGFDCSGYVRYVYAKNGIDLPRTAREQYVYGKKINLKRAKPGDLLFFRTSGRKVSHVAIYTGDNSFLHAPSEGKEVSFCDLDNSYWGRRYIGAATYLRRNF